MTALSGRPLVMMVSDRRLFDDADDRTGRGLVEAARRAAHTGVDFIQVRERDLDGGDLLGLSVRLTEATAGTSTRVVINDRADVALAAGASGVHLPASGLPAGGVRAIAPGGFLIGRSVHSETEAIEIARAGSCDYLVFGTIFESVSKPQGHPVAGLEALSRVCAAVRLPVIAIGGITLARVADVARAGAAGIAAISLFARSGGDDMTRMMSDIRAAFANINR